MNLASFSSASMSRKESSAGSYTSPKMLENLGGRAGVGWWIDISIYMYIPETWIWGWKNNFERGAVDHVPNMASTFRVQLGVYDGPCSSQRLSPYENKIGGYPVSKQHLRILVVAILFCLFSGLFS